MGIFKKLFEKFDGVIISDNLAYFDINDDAKCGKKKREKLEFLRSEREYYKIELEKEKNKPKKSLIRVWDLECKLGEIEDLIIKELKK
ncbi:hypothetical protein A966_12636 [Brachyspira hampsonii 30446]|uniref:Uncharacterized protein n=2 Tax=Brachyspira hampsonii TaxID=1287055 RepID=A0A2U4EUC6_9SPIR|nr:hypothetical protein [Brachyspira hampsonii]EKV56206.1 hypothetical protein A966_12636 [Brachyspira hampsonii 30446]MBW5396113.1 hypothetical protein [Brachyspira hampsonii]OEJ20099.1 hypothetical protein A9495_02370 [Brachyspira hampsonii]